MKQKRLKRIFIGEGWPYLLRFINKRHMLSSAKNRKKFWCRCKNKCICKPWKFYAEQ